jgi:hypothetical protein
MDRLGQTQRSGVDATIKLRPSKLFRIRLHPSSPRPAPRHREMSASGTLRTLMQTPSISALGCEADIARPLPDVC